MDELLKEIQAQFKDKLGENSLVLVEKGKKAHVFDEKDNVIVSNNGEWVKADKISEMTEQKKKLNEQIDALNTELETIKKNSKDSEELTKTIEDLQSAIANNKLESEKTETRFKFRDALRGAKAKDNYIDLLEKAVDITQIKKSDDGNLLEVDSMIAKLKESYPDSFGEVVIDPAKPKNTGGGNGLPEGILSKDEIRAMSQAEVNTNLEAVNKSLEYHESVN